MFKRKQSLQSLMLWTRRWKGRWDSVSFLITNWKYNTTFSTNFWSTLMLFVSKMNLFCRFSTKNLYFLIFSHLVWLKIITIYCIMWLMSQKPQSSYLDHSHHRIWKGAGKPEVGAIQSSHNFLKTSHSLILSHTRQLSDDFLTDGCQILCYYLFQIRFYNWIWIRYDTGENCMFGREEDLFVEDYSDFHYLLTANPPNWETNS